MSSIGASEIILVLLIAFIVVGPNDLPKVGRALGRFVRTLKMILQEVKKETGLDEVEGEIKDIKREINKTTKDLDIRQQLKEAGKDIDTEIKGVKAEFKSGELKDIQKDLERDIDHARKDISRELKPSGKKTAEQDPGEQNQ